MRRCDHSQWLSLCTQGNETAFLESDRLQELVDHIPNPDTQYPSLLVLVGSTAKSIALQELVSAKNCRKSKRSRHQGDICLHLDASSIFCNRPVLFADGGLPDYTSSHGDSSTEGCHETIRRILPGVQEGGSKIALSEAADDLYSRLLCPFTDVFCFFTADFGRFRPIVRLLASWLEKGRPSTLPSTTYPRVVIVTESEMPEVGREKEAREIFLRMVKEETTKDLLNQFSAVDVLSLFTDGRVSTQARHRRLKECLMNASDQVRMSRVDARTLFSAMHFVAFFKLACDHFARYSKEPFDFIKSSRLRNPISPDLAEYLSSFLKSNIKSSRELMRFAVPMIASSFLLDNYPPDMHTFSPADVFQVLYRDICYQVSRSGVLAYENTTSMLLPSGFVMMIEGQLARWFENFIQGTGTPSAEIHHKNIQRFNPKLREIRNGNTCLVCLRRKPEYSLPCGHSLCENCVRVFGECSEQDAWVFEIRCCFLCGLELSEVTVKVKPPTAGVRVLCIDGGGARGIVPLQSLQLLQERLGMPCLIQENFEVAFGTSSGFLIVLAMFINGWSAEDCANIFENLAKMAFQPRIVAQIPILSRIQELLTTYLADSLYPADNLEAALKDVFGSDRGIMDCSHATATGTKVGMPATTIPGTSSCIFTNYNGVGVRPQDCGYSVVRPKDGFSRLLLWEIARCGSAAPWFFRPKCIPEVGTFQDGGLWQNNPIDIAFWEIPAIWPLVEEPDFVVSLGTGYPRVQTEVPHPSGPRGIWRDGFIPRLYRAFMSSMSSKRFWQEFQNRRRAVSKGQYFRLDIEFDGREPGLDDTSKMQELGTKARAELSKSGEIDTIVQCIIASFFYFELESTPKKRNGQYSGAGHILCRLRRGHPAFEVLLGRLSKSSARFFLEDHSIPGRVEDRSFFDRRGNFRKRVEFKARNEMSIYLKEESCQRRNISGSPFSMDALIAVQDLNADFGRADHKKRRRPGDVELPKKWRRTSE